MKWVTQYCRLTKVSKGVSAKYMRQFFILVSCIRHWQRLQVTSHTMDFIRDHTN